MVTQSATLAINETLQARYAAGESVLQLGFGEAGLPVLPEVAWAWRRLAATCGAVPVGELAAEVGWSRRHLVTRFHQQVGLPPKTAARVIRFAHLLRRFAGTETGKWSRIAAECGYYDQAHMNRDFREFAGTTPTDYLARRVTSVQYEWVAAE